MGLLEKAGKISEETKSKPKAKAKPKVWYSYTCHMTVA